MSQRLEAKVAWVGYEIESGYHFGTHGETIACRICRCNCPKVIRVVDDGCEEIDSLDYGQVFSEFVYTSIVARIGTEQDVLIGGAG